MKVINKSKYKIDTGNVNRTFKILIKIKSDCSNLIDFTNQVNVKNVTEYILKNRL